MTKRINVSDLTGQGGSSNTGKGLPVQGQGTTHVWKFRYLKSFEKCFYCKTLLKKGQRVYCKVGEYGTVHACTSHGDPADWNLRD